VKVIRRSPVTRATAWVLTVALISPTIAVGRAAKAQDQQVLKVVIADTVNKASGASKTLGINATAAISTELAASGLGKFNVVSTTEVRNEATNAGLKVPSNPSAPYNFSETEWLRIAKNLGADAIVTSEVGATKAVGKGGGVNVAITVALKDVASNTLTSGGSGSVTEFARPGESVSLDELLTKGVSDAALKAVRDVLSHSVVSGTVLNITSDQVIINRGLRDGVKVGDRVQILRDAGNGSRFAVGEIRILRAYATDSEASVISNTGGISPEDVARVVYTAPAIIPAAAGPVLASSKETLKPNTAHSSLSMSAVGGTLAVIGVGVLLAAANKGGQVSVTDLTAEPTSQANGAAVLVRWRDNIFGQGNVQQYKIYREPDFAYVSVGTTGNGNSGGTSTTNAAYPVAVRAGVDHSYLDLPSPNFAYANGGQILVGSSNGGLGSSGASSGGNSNGNNNNNSTGSIAAPATLDTGFTPGKSYLYQVTAIILRQIPSSGSSNGTGTGGGIGGGGGGIGGGGGNNGGGNGNGNSGGSEYIETDPAVTATTTPVTPVQMSTPTAAAGNVNVRQFAPTWLSSVGADVFQVEISLDRLFKTPSQVYQTGLIVSTAPYANGVTQTVPAPIDLSVLPQLLANPSFAAFVAQTSGSSPSSPLIYWRVGARHDEDNPGPVNWITNNSTDSDRSFRFVYPLPQYFTAAPGPPAPPSKSARALNALYTNRGLLAPGVGSSNNSRGSSGARVLSPQDILTGRGRTRN
jgi:hypothetical protein